MSMGLFGSLPRLAGRRKRTSQVPRPAAPCGRPSLESLETRALPSVLLATSRTVPLGELAVSVLAAGAGPMNDLQSAAAPSRSSGQADGPPSNPGGGSFPQL